MPDRTHTSIPGQLISLPLPGRKLRHLDGFWVTGKKNATRLLIFVHGMGSNFYKSQFKKAWMRLAPPRGLDVFCFNNRGCESDVADETFTDCLADLDAALAFARREGYREIILLGHSTGCQKITFYTARRKPADVKALLLTAIGDDLAIARRDLGRDYTRWLNKARKLVEQGRGEERLPARALGFSARRFLSAAAPESVEANLFRLDGELRTFRRLTLPVLAVFPEQEEYACIPVQEAGAILACTTRSSCYGNLFIPEADHSFHGQEEACVNACLRWLKHNLQPNRQAATAAPSGTRHSV